LLFALSEEILRRPAQTSIYVSLFRIHSDFVNIDRLLR
jgi:hypothetical protein